MIQKLLISAGCIALINLSALPAAHAFDEARMLPAQRMHVEGEQASGRDRARAHVRRGTALTDRGRPYDEIRPASAPKRARSVRKARQPKRTTRRTKTIVGSRGKAVVQKK